ncbi:MAG TPA: hypothetical protein DCF68_08395 [Cyanothece sp. UBA12306]|nr:hypothetical protein [Cyanothece sp. UBA12306]
MKVIIVTGSLVISSVIGTLILAPKGQASPQCYGVDQSGATLDLSELCSPSKQTLSPPSNAPINTTESEKKPATEEPNQAEKDLKNCLKSPQCSRVLGGDSGINNNQLTPRQGRIDQLRNGGSIK